MDTEGDRGAQAQRLDEAMNARRRDLRLRWKQVSDRAGMTYGNLHRIRTGQIAITEFASDGLESALRWQAGSVAAVLAGGAPTSVHESAESDMPLTEEQQQLLKVYKSYEKDYGPDEALRRIREDVTEINAIRDRERRSAG